MPYPQAPWNLKGFAIQTLQLLDIERSRQFIPPELEVVSFLPGKTLGGIYIASYRSGSVLEYSELIVTSAMVRYGNKTGAWVSHIYVNNPDSVAGGREIWGLPKELADFSWEKEQGDRYTVTVRKDNKQLCSLNYSRQRFGWQQKFSGSVISSLDSNLLFFTGEVESRLGPVSGKLAVLPESPFVGLRLGQPWLTFYYDQLNFTAGVPEVIGQKAGLVPEKLLV